MDFNEQYEQLKRVCKLDDFPGFHEPTKFRPFFKSGKPKITVPAKPDGLDNSQWFHALQAEVLNRLTNPSSLTQPLVLAYVHSLCGKMKEKVPEVWTSFGLTIAEAGQEVTPLDLLMVKADSGVKLELTASPGKLLSLKGEIGLVVLLLYGYKIWVKQCHSNDQYKNNLKSQVYRTFASHFSELGLVQNVALLDKFTSFCNDTAVTNLICAMDMWLNRFPSNQYSEIRFITRDSRDQGMSAVTDLNFIMETTGLTASQIKQWVWEGWSSSQLEKIFNPDEELLLPYSYSHYRVAMGTTNPSPYTTKINRNFHVWAVTVGALFQKSRGLNDKKSCDEYSFSTICLNAAYFAYAMLKPRNTRSETLPKGSDPIEWFEYFKRMNRTYPKEIKKFASDKIRHLQPTEPNSILAAIRREWQGFEY